MYHTVYPTVLPRHFPGLVVALLKTGSYQDWGLAALELSWQAGDFYIFNLFFTPSWKIKNPHIQRFQIKILIFPQMGGSTTT